MKLGDPPPLVIARVVPDAVPECAAGSSPMVVAAPVVHAVVTVPVPWRALVALATIGSYGPKASGAVLMVHTLATDALTLRLVDCAPARAELARAIIATTA